MLCTQRERTIARALPAHGRLHSGTLASFAANGPIASGRALKPGRRRAGAVSRSSTAAVDVNGPIKHAPFFKDFIKGLPKVELHQHLTGSLDNAGLRRALEQKGLAHLARDIRSLSDEDTDSWEHLVKYCSACAIAVDGGGDGRSQREFYADAFELLRKDGVMYCELRVGLKPQPTKQRYLERILNAVERANGAGGDLQIGILVSVARHGDVNYGRESAEIAIELWKQGRAHLCGIELGGVPAEADFTRDWKPTFDAARAVGMPIALHCGEDSSEAKQREWREMIEWGPDRLGHCVLLDDANFERLTKADRRIPVETCLTCHDKHFGVPVPENVFVKLREAKHPVSLATDNPSILGVSLSDEYILACETFNLSTADVVHYARQAIDFTFLSAAGKASLTKRFDGRVQELLRRHGIEPCGGVAASETPPSYLRSSL